MKCHNVRGGTRKTASHRRKELALALCVSLWMAGGSVAGARDTTVTDTNAPPETAYGHYKPVFGNNDGTYAFNKSGTPSNNTIAIKLTNKVAEDVYGAEYTTPDENVSNNTAEIISGTVTGTVYGGSANGGTAGGASEAEGNKVIVKGGTVQGSVYGGKSNLGAATNNTVTISKGTTNPAINGNVYGGHSEGGAANKNTVEISGGTINRDVIGGFSGNNFGTGTGNATGNEVHISGGTVTGNIIGGKTQKGNASNNVVTISGDANLTETVRIYGGLSANGGNATGNTVNILTSINVKHILGGDGATSAGNTLNLAAKGVTVGTEGLFGFQNLNFYLPTDMTTTDTMLTVNGTAEVDGAKVGVLAQGKLNSLKKDDKVKLLHADTMNGTVSQTTEIDVPESIATVNTYEFTVTSDANNIYATITKAPEEGGGGEGGGGSKNDEAHQNTKSVVETKAATTTFVNAGADMLASQGFAQAANAVALETAEQGKNGAEGAPVANGFTPFAAFGGSSLRAESGSHVDTKGFGLNVGFAREIANSQGKLLFGPVVEYGGGSYDSYLDNGVHGDGGAHYFGVGLMARQVNHDGFYYEGSLRGGRVKSDYKGSFNLQNVDYDSSSNYWAAHLGIGKVFATGKQDTVDGYLKYFYSHQSGDSVTMHGSVTGDEDWSFDSVDSHRIRLGARLTHKVNERNSFYGGLAYQYEFDGEARASYADGSTPRPSVKGSSGMLELGWQVKPGNGPMTLDLGVNGWAGKQHGGSVHLGATWTF